MFARPRQPEPFSVNKYGTFGAAGTWVTVSMFTCPNGKIVRLKRFGCFIVAAQSKAGPFATGWTTLVDNQIAAVPLLIDEIQIKTKINGAELSYFQFNLTSFGTLSSDPQTFEYDFYQSDKLTVEFRQIATSSISTDFKLIFRCDGTIDNINVERER